MSISLTERAAEHVKSFLASEDNVDSLRLAVKRPQNQLSNYTNHRSEGDQRHGKDDCL